MKDGYRKILIVGPCSTGKTTLAMMLSRKLMLPYFCLDDLFIDFDSITATHRKFYPLKKVNMRIKNVLNYDNWVVEGPYVINQFFIDSDLIIFTFRSVITALLWQWKRFFTDSVQIKKWGLFNNLLLSKLIIKQYYIKSSEFEFQEVRYPTMVLFKKLANKYKDKVVIVRRRESNSSLFNRLSLVECKV